MYSPRISEVFIPHLYRMAKQNGEPMTKLVNRIIEKEVKKYLKGGGKYAGQDKANPCKYFGRV